MVISPKRKLKVREGKLCVQLISKAPGQEVSSGWQTPPPFSCVCCQPYPLHPQTQKFTPFNVALLLTRKHPRALAQRVRLWHFFPYPCSSCPHSASLCSVPQDLWPAGGSSSPLGYVWLLSSVNAVPQGSKEDPLSTDQPLWICPHLPPAPQHSWVASPPIRHPTWERLPAPLGGWLVSPHTALTFHLRWHRVLLQLVYASISP